VLSISARVDYAVQVLCALADTNRTMTARQLSVSLGLPHKFLEAILTDLQRGVILTSRRGVAGGYRLARPAGEISVHEVIRSLVGSLAEVRGQTPEAIDYHNSTENLRAAWMAVRSSLRLALEGITIADIVTGDLSRVADPAAPSGATQGPAVDGVRSGGSGSYREWLSHR
jgi:Rrf2 family protein